MDQQEGFHIDLPLLHDESYLVYLPKATLHTWEEPLGGRIIVENLKQWWRLLNEESTRGGGEILQYPCSCLRTSNIWEGKTVIFLN